MMSICEVVIFRLHLMVWLRRLSVGVWGKALLVRPGPIGELVGFGYPDVL